MVTFELVAGHHRLTVRQIFRRDPRRRCAVSAGPVALGQIRRTGASHWAAEGVPGTHRYPSEAARALLQAAVAQGTAA